MVLSMQERFQSQMNNSVMSSASSSTRPSTFLSSPAGTTGAGYSYFGYSMEPFMMQHDPKPASMVRNSNGCFYGTVVPESVQHTMNGQVKTELGNQFPMSVSVSSPVNASLPPTFGPSQVSASASGSSAALVSSDPAMPSAFSYAFGPGMALSQQTLTNGSRPSHHNMPSLILGNSVQVRNHQQTTARNNSSSGSNPAVHWMQPYNYHNGVLGSAQSTSAAASRINPLLFSAQNEAFFNKMFQEYDTNCGGGFFDLSNTCQSGFSGLTTSTPPAFGSTPIIAPQLPFQSSAAVPSSVSPQQPISSTGISMKWIGNSDSPPEGKTRTKEKYRKVYTVTQRSALEAEFRLNNYIPVGRKSEVSRSLGLSDRQVKIWFQNRRAKERRVRREISLAYGITNLGSSSKENQTKKPQLSPVKNEFLVPSLNNNGPIIL